MLLRMMLFIVITVLCYSQYGMAQSVDEKEVRRGLQLQTDAWNDGNIEEFMQMYWQSDSLLFIGKSGPKYGFATTLKNYKKNYPDTAAMGKLRFNLMQVKRLSAKYYFVVGQWHLQRSIGNAGGYFTLLLQRIKNKWVIINDHSS